MKRSTLLFSVLTGVFILLAVVFYFFVIGYRFTGLACFGCALVFFCFFLLSRMQDKPRARCFRRILLILIALGLVGLTLTELPIVGASTGAGKDIPCRYVIVLGAGLNGETPSISLSDRLHAAATYLKNNPDAVAVVTGGIGEGETITEAEAMQRALVGAGILPERILKEEQAKNTRENIIYSLALIREREGGTLPAQIAILSSEYHLYRAGYLAAQCEVSAVLIPARTSLSILRFNYFFREAFAVWNLWLFGG